MTNSFPDVQHIPLKSKRLGAFLIDAGLLFLIQFIGSFLGAIVASLAAGFSPDQVRELEWVAVQGGNWGARYWFAVAFVLNFGVAQGLTGQSFGKWALGLKVYKQSGREIGISLSLVRSLLYYISIFPMYLGFISVFFHKHALGIHDWICKTVVTHKDVEIVSNQKQSAEIIPLRAPADQVLLPAPDNKKETA